MLWNRVNVRHGTRNGVYGISGSPGPGPSTASRRNRRGRERHGTNQTCARLELAHGGVAGVLQRESGDRRLICPGMPDWPNKRSCPPPPRASWRTPHGVELWAIRRHVKWRAQDAMNHRLERVVVGTTEEERFGPTDFGNEGRRLARVPVTGGTEKMTAWLAAVRSRPLTLGLIGRHPRTRCVVLFVQQHMRCAQTSESVGSRQARKYGWMMHSTLPQPNGKSRP